MIHRHAFLCMTLRPSMFSYKRAHQRTATDLSTQVYVKFFLIQQTVVIEVNTEKEKQNKRLSTYLLGSSWIFVHNGLKSSCPFPIQQTMVIEVTTEKVEKISCSLDNYLAVPGNSYTVACNLAE